MNQKALTAREVSQVLREAALGDRPFRRVGHQMSELATAGMFTIDIEGWVITFSIDIEQLVQCYSCFSPDGRSYDFQSPLNKDTDPIALLMPLELEQLEALLSAGVDFSHPAPLCN
ncbi:DUF7693 family protein [Pseudomonas juntendi]|uniref:DUF7693 family protein n=1 Tax=Pseudomonas juntendi TaxID=2666183 RepID=UPI003D36A503